MDYRGWEERETETQRNTQRGKETEKGGWDLEGKMLIGNGMGIGEEGMGNWIYQPQYMYAWILNKLFFDSGPSSAEASSTCMLEFLRLYFLSWSCVGLIPLTQQVGMDCEKLWRSLICTTLAQLGFFWLCGPLAKAWWEDRTLDL